MRKKRVLMHAILEEYKTLVRNFPVKTQSLIIFPQKVVFYIIEEEKIRTFFKWLLNFSRVKSHYAKTFSPCSNFIFLKKILNSILEKLHF